MSFEIELPDPDELLEDGSRQLLERTYKRDGIWRVHLNDPDTVFPSDFHAHNQDAPQTLDVYTGEVYDPTTKRLVRTLRKKTMKYLHQQLSSSNEDALKLKCAQAHLFSFL